ncbi:MAG: DUF2784 domain-containing protein [Acidobacteriota bacterium]|nr:DUF2784 domain-containing protein [Acidobacteriota bacterium]
MLYQLAADVLSVTHMAFVVFVGIGVVAVWRWPRLVWCHVPAIFWGVTVELSGGVCPLTPLEQWLLTQGGQMGYQGAFLTHYLSPLLYPTGLTVDWQLFLASLAVVVNVFGYYFVWRFPRRLNDDM